MLHCHVDCSMDYPIVATGYVIYRTRNGAEELLDTGTRVFNANADERNIEWCSNRAEYYAAIVGVRAALDYTNEAIILNVDNEAVVEAIREGAENIETYFHHALWSFLPRFDDYYVNLVHRKNNEAAHQQARVGLHVAREIQAGV